MLLQLFGLPLFGIMENEMESTIYGSECRVLS